MKKIIALAAFLALSCSSVEAQKSGRWSARVAQDIAFQKPLTSVIIEADDAPTTAAELQQQGIRARVITPHTLTARMPASLIPTVALRKGVGYIDAAHQLQPRMDSVRTQTGADRLHNGDLLDTPYTGKGVVVGVIDQGFEYKHIAFLDDNNQPRTLAVWNRSGYSTGSDAEPTTDIPSNGDGIDGSGHACHVTNIAAGSRISENEWHGIAPEADIIMIPSEFNSAEILEDIRYISDFATERGEPWVINMSFGSSGGSHDGLTSIDRAIDTILAEAPGRAICVAAGNDGLNRVHATHTFARDGETVRLLMESGSYGQMCELWCQAADSARHLTARPFVWQNGEADYKDSAYWENYYYDAVATYNRKQCVAVGMPYNTLAGRRIGIEVSAAAGTTFHAWTYSYYGSFTQAPDSTFISGDYDMQVDGTFATANHAITVAASVSKQQYENISGQTVGYNHGPLGSIATFSSAGPALCDSLKPTVAAPGSVVCSAVSKYGSTFSPTGSTIVQDVKRGLKHFYYAAFYGTSMATPVVTGSIALWLQANPNLSISQIHQIIRQTSSSGGSWDSHAGYGIINTYDGLRAALALADQTGIPRTIATAQPITICRRAGAWRILFNSPEPWAQITLSDMAGRTLLTTRLTRVDRADEHSLSTASLPAGTYILHVSTQGGQVSKKIILT